MSPNNFPWGHLMKIEWLVTNVTVVGSPDIAERAILEVILAGHFLAYSGRICGRGATLWKPLLSPNKFSCGHLMKIESLVANVPAVGSPGRRERTILGVILAGYCFGQFRPYL